MGKKKDLKMKLDTSKGMLAVAEAFVKAQADLIDVLALVIEENVKVGRGDKFIGVHTGSVYTLSEVEDNVVCLIKDSTSNRYQSPVLVNNVHKLTVDEIVSVFSKRGDLRCFAKKFKRA